MRSPICIVPKRRFTLWWLNQSSDKLVDRACCTGRQLEQCYELLLGDLGEMAPMTFALINEVNISIAEVVLLLASLEKHLLKFCGVRGVWHGTILSGNPACSAY